MNLKIENLQINGVDEDANVGLWDISATEKLSENNQLGLGVASKFSLSRPMPRRSCMVLIRIRKYPLIPFQTRILYQPGILMTFPYPREIDPYLAFSGTLKPPRNITKTVEWGRKVQKQEGRVLDI